MFVCICHRYREQDIRRAAHSGLQSAHDIYRRLGAEPRCGRCLESAEKLIEDVRVGSQTGSTPGVARSA